MARQVMADLVLEVRAQRSDDRVTDVALAVQVITDDPSHLARATDVFARAAAGLALEGISVSIYAETISENEDEEAT